MLFYFPFHIELIVVCVDRVPIGFLMTCKIRDVTQEIFEVNV